MLDIREDIQNKPDFSGMPFRLILHLLDPEVERNVSLNADVERSTTR
jgi:hypothetical protein